MACDGGSDQSRGDGDVDGTTSSGNTDSIRVEAAQLAGESQRALSRTKHVWYSEHGTYYQFEFILERAMSATHIAVILRTRTSPAYEEEFTKMDYPDARNEYGTS